MLSLLISMASYALFVFFAGASAFRDASGNITDIVNGTFVNCSGALHCEYGLANSYTVSKTFKIQDQTVNKSRDMDITLYITISSQTGHETPLSS